MDVQSFRRLLTSSGQQAVQSAQALQPRENDFLRHFDALARVYPVDLARAALEIAILRGEAGAKFPFAEKLYLTREALEQATAWPVAVYRAGRYRAYERVLDLGCSVGADTLALAGVSQVSGIDLDPLRLNMAAANLRALGLQDRAAFIQADLRAALPLRPATGQAQRVALFFDPARRARQRRVFSVADYQPPLAVMKEWLKSIPACGVKISPGVNLVELADYDAGIEFISLNGELKEAVLWFGPLKTATRQATLLPGGDSLSGEPDESRAGAPPSTQPPLAYIYEPDPAVLRAGLVRSLAASLDAAQMDVDIAYLTAKKLQPTPFARVWAVEDWMPFGLKRLRAYLRERGIGRVTVKKRGSPLEPESLIRQLRLKGEEERVLFLTHYDGQPVVVIGKPVED